MVQEGASDMYICTPRFPHSGRRRGPQSRLRIRTARGAARRRGCRGGGPVLSWQTASGLRLPPTKFPFASRATARSSSATAPPANGSGTHFKGSSFTVMTRSPALAPFLKAAMMVTKMVGSSRESSREWNRSFKCQSRGHITICHIQ